MVCTCVESLGENELLLYEKKGWLRTQGIFKQSPPVCVWLNSSVASIKLSRSSDSGGPVPPLWPWWCQQCLVPTISVQEVIPFLEPRLFMLCDWIIWPAAREATFVARLGCFSAFAWELIVSAPECTIPAYSVFCLPHCEERGPLFIKTHFPPSPGLFISTYKAYYFFLWPFWLLKPQLSPLCLF